jgi:hypothetical protein
MSSSSACSEYVLPAADCPCADTDAPLGTIGPVASCFRFTSDGDAGAGGSDGGVRVPLAAMVIAGMRCSRCASDVVGVNASRAAAVVVSRSRATSGAESGSRALLVNARKYPQIRVVGVLGNCECWRASGKGPATDGARGAKTNARSRTTWKPCCRRQRCTVRLILRMDHARDDDGV